MSVFSPFVYWAQNEDNVFLKVDLKDVKNPKIDFEDKSISFHATGAGAQGFKAYYFKLNLFGSLNKSENNVKLNDNSVNLKLSKAERGWWPRLISTPQKPTWLKIDFDRWQSEDDLLDEEINDIREDYPELYNRLQKDEIGYIKEDFKKVYLTIYNILMMVGFLYIQCVLCTNYGRDGPLFFPKTYSTVGPAMCIMQLFQVLEIMHPMFGYVKGGVTMPFMQIFGRLFILFAMLEYEPGLQEMPVVFYLFFIWSAIEVIRYPYYITQLLKKEVYVLKWLRYSAWIILYPLGFVCESVIIFRNMIFVQSSHKWSLTLPNPYNFTFDFLSCLRIYMTLLMFPAMYILMKHMYKVRVKKLGGFEPFKRNNISFKPKQK